MATRSTIWVETENGFKGVYCHFDGYIDSVGAELKLNYNSKEKAEELISLGHLSTVFNEVEAYHRDRGEDFGQYEVSELLEIFDFKEEYNYVFINGGWKLLEDTLIEYPDPKGMNKSSDKGPNIYDEVYYMTFESLKLNIKKDTVVSLELKNDEIYVGLKDCGLSFPREFMFSSKEECIEFYSNELKKLSK